MANPNQTPVDPFTVSLPCFHNTDRFKGFIDEWRAELAKNGKGRVFEKIGVLPVLPVEVENQQLIKIRLAANGANLGVYITPDSLYTVGFVCQSGKEYALFETSKHLLPNSVNAHEILLKDEPYGTMGGFIEDNLNGNILANKLINAIEGLANPKTKTITDMGKKMGVIVQVIIEPIRFRILQEQYICFFSENAHQVALKTPIKVSTDNEGGSGQNDRVASDPVETQASGSVTVKVRGIYSNQLHKWIEKEWGSLSRIALEAHENGKYKQKGYELKGCKTYRLKNNASIKFETIQDLVKALGVAKEKGSSKSSTSSKIASLFQKKLRF